jgi:protein ImuA
VDRAGAGCWPPRPRAFGLSPADLVLVQAPRRQDALWAMEESLRCPGVAGALLARTRWT